MVEYLLWVCDSNITRSPAAAYLSKKAIAELCVTRGIESTLVVDSAGLRQGRELGMKEEMVQALMYLGHPRSDAHRVKLVTSTMLQKYEDRGRILCFEEKQAQGIVEISPHLESRVRTPSMYGLPGGDIISPDDIITDIPLQHVLLNLPYIARKWIYGKLGGTNRKDRMAVLELHVDTVRRIEEYVRLALEKMLEEGFGFK